MRLMTDHHFRHLPVLEGDRIAGIVSIGDLVNWIISAQTSTISQLQTYITGVQVNPYRPRRRARPRNQQDRLTFD